MSKPDSSTKKKTGGNPVPWEEYAQDSVFFPPQIIDASRWNKFYPYRLVVYDVREGAMVGGLNIFNSVQQGTTRQGIEFLSYNQDYTNSNYWECILPITPQQLQITDQYAIATSATMRGVAEEHNGIKFKMIAGSGTTGIWPRKTSRQAVIESPPSWKSIAAGTLR